MSDEVRSVVRGEYCGCTFVATVRWKPGDRYCTLTVIGRRGERYLGFLPELLYAATSGEAALAVAARVGKQALMRWSGRTRRAP